MNAFFLTTAAFLLCTATRSSECNRAQKQLASIEQFTAAGNFESAERALEQLEHEVPDCPELLFWRARLNEARGRLAEADAEFERYAEQEPDNVLAHSYRAELLFKLARYEQADELSRRALSIDPHDAVALAVQASILDISGRSVEATEMFERACAARPNDSELHFRAGTLYDRLKRPGDAVRHFEKTAELSPSNPRAWDFLALNLEPLGKLDRADLAYRNGLKVNQPGPLFDSYLDYNYGRFLMKRNELVASKEHLDRAVELAPQVRATWYERARLHLWLKNYERARDDAERAASIRDRQGVILDLQVYVLLERIYLQLGNAQLARKYADLSRRTPVPPRKDLP